MSRLHHAARMAESKYRVLCVLDQEGLPLDQAMTVLQDALRSLEGDSQESETLPAIDGERRRKLILEYLAACGEVSTTRLKEICNVRPHNDDGAAFNNHLAVMHNRDEIERCGPRVHGQASRWRLSPKGRTMMGVEKTPKPSESTS